MINTFIMMMMIVMMMIVMMMIVMMMIVMMMIVMMMIIPSSGIVPKIIEHCDSLVSSSFNMMMIMMMMMLKMLMIMMIMMMIMVMLKMMMMMMMTMIPRGSEFNVNGNWMKLGTTPSTSSLGHFIGNVGKFSKAA